MWATLGQQLAEGSGEVLRRDRYRRATRMRLKEERLVPCVDLDPFTELGVCEHSSGTGGSTLHEHH